MLERQAGARRRARVRTCNRGHALRRNDKPGHDPCERGLAAPVRTFDHHRLAGINVQVARVECSMGPRRPGVVHVADAREIDRGTAARRTDLAVHASVWQQVAATTRHRAGHGARGCRSSAQLAGLEGNRDIAQCRFVLVVGDVHDGRRARRQPPVEGHQLGAALVVDHRGRLVRHDETGLARQGRRDGQALQLSTRQRRGVTVVEARQPDAPERVVDCGGRAIWRAPGHVVTHAHAEHLRLGALEDHRGAAGFAEAGRAGSLDAPSGGDESGEHAAERRLARSVVTDHGDQPACGHVDVDVVEGRYRGSVVAQRHVVEARRAPAPPAVCRARTR